MAEKNRSEKENSKKKYKWIGIFLIALLLLFIGFAGYYLERDLEPLSENNLNNEQKTEQSIEDDNGFFSDMVEKIKNSMSDDSSEGETNLDNGESASINESHDQLSEEELLEEKQKVLNSAKEKLESGEINQEEYEEIKKEAELFYDNSYQSDQSEKSATLSTDSENTEGQKTETASESDIEKDSSKSSEAESRETSSLFEQLLSILGIKNSNFNQDLNILFVGLDDEESVALGSVEADSIMLGYLRPKNKKMQIKQIDEDQKYQGKALRDYYNGEIVKIVKTITETEIDYYVYVRYQGFEKVIDELGGVKINLDESLKIPALSLDLKAGDNLLSGREALNFVRWKGENSLSRYKRQKLLINAIVNKLKGNNFLFNVKEIYNTIIEGYNSIETDIDSVLAVEIFNYIRENDDFEIEYLENS